MLWASLHVCLSSSSTCNFFHVIHPFGLSIMFSLFPYFTPKLFCFLCIQLLVCFRAFSIYLMVEFSFVILEYPVLFVLLEPSQIGFWVSPLSPISLICLFKLNFQTSSVLFRYFHPYYYYYYYLLIRLFHIRILSFISTCLMVSASMIPKYLYVLFSASVLILSWFGSSIPSVRCRFSTFHYKNCTFFPCQIPFLCPWLYILTACIRVSSTPCEFFTQC